MQKIGAIGPAITIVIATFLQISYYLWEAKQLLKNISIKKFLPYKEIIILFAISLISGLAAYFVKNLFDITIIKLIVSSFAFLGVSIVLLIIVSKSRFI